VSTAILPVKDIPPDARAWLGQVLDREIGVNDYCEVTLRSANPLRVPTPEQKRAAAERLEKLFQQIDERNRGIPEPELEEIVDEALAAVRGRKC